MICFSKLTINPIVIDRSTFNHSEAPLTITNPTATSTSVINDSKAVLHLCRQGTDSQAYGARASFKLCRYENSAANSRTRLDITLAHNTYDDLNIMSLQSGGNVGVGTTNPQRPLHVQTAMRIGGSGACIDFGDDMKNQIYRNGTTNELRFTTNATDRLVINPSGNIGIGTTNPTTAKLVISGTASIDSLVALQMPQIINNKVITPIMSLFFILNFMMLSNTIFNN